MTRAEVGLWIFGFLIALFVTLLVWREIIARKLRKVLKALLQEQQSLRQRVFWRLIFSARALGDVNTLSSAESSHVRKLIQLNWATFTVATLLLVFPFVAKPLFGS